MTRAGGGFGRRLENDFVGEAVLIAQGGRQARQADLDARGRSAARFLSPVRRACARARRSIASKKVTSWSHCCAATPRPYRENGRKRRIFDGCLEPDDFPAGLVANLDKTFFSVPSGMPRGWWRAPIHTFHAFSVQSFVDEIAVATKQDAVELRLEMLGEPRQIPYSGHGGPTFDTGRLAERAASSAPSGSAGASSAPTATASASPATSRSAATPRTRSRCRSTAAS